MQSHRYGAAALRSEALRNIGSDVDRPSDGAINLCASKTDVFELPVAQRFEAGNRRFTNAPGVVGIPYPFQATHHPCKRFARSVLVRSCSPRNSAHDRLNFLGWLRHTACVRPWRRSTTFGHGLGISRRYRTPPRNGGLILAGRAGRQYFSTGPRSAALTPPVNRGAGGDY
jgi:hypothetical protein